MCASALSQQPETFRADTRLVLVPVAIHDKTGAHVSGLTKEQFKISQDGNEQTIGVFEEVHAKKQALVPEPVRPPEFSNAVAEAASARALTIIAVDLINTPPTAVTYVKKDLLKYIGTMAEGGEPTALVTLEPGRTHVVYDFTTDPKLLAEAVKHLQTRQTLGTNTAGEAVSGAAHQEAASLLGVVQAGGAPQSAQDSASLERVLQAFTNAKSMADKYARFEQAQTRRDTLDALRTLATALKAFPGRKSLIWVSGGIPYTEDALQMQQQRRELGSNAPPVPASTTSVRSVGGTSGTGGTPTPTTPGGPGGRPVDPSRAFTTDPMRDSAPTIDASRDLVLQRGLPSTEALNDHTLAWGVLNDANVAVYPVDARRLVNTAFDVINPRDQKYSSQAMDREGSYFKAQEIITTFENIAAATGGKPCFNRTDLADCFHEAVADGESYYLLGYYVPKQTKVGWHKIQVKSGVRDVSVRARNGFQYSAVDFDSRAAVQQDMLAAISSSMNTFAVPFRGSFGSTTERNAKKAVQFELRVARDGLTVDQANGNRIALDFVAIAYAPGGDAAAKLGQTVDTRLKPEAMAQIQQGGLRYRNLLELPPGHYVVQFVVRDNLTGRMGSLRTPLEVQ